MWHRGSCCTTKSLCDPGVQHPAPRGAACRKAERSQSASRPGSAEAWPQQWPLVSLACMEKAGDRLGKHPFCLSDDPGTAPLWELVPAHRPLATDMCPWSYVWVKTVLSLQVPQQGLGSAALSSLHK